MAVTMKDIARDLGVSVVTVSKVLRNHSDIGAETRKRVLKRMKELNYHPNPAARTLVSGRTNLIGLIVPDLVHPFFAQVAKGISAKLRTVDYSLIISSSEDNPALETSERNQMLERQVGDIIQYGDGDDSGDQAGYVAMKQLLTRRPRADGVFCCNDPIALGAMRAIMDAGLQIPGDIAVVGCGNLNYADFLRVPLTSIDQDSDKLGTHAAKLALSLIKRSEEHTSELQSPDHLVCRLLLEKKKKIVTSMQPS